MIMKKIILTGCVGFAMLFASNANAQGFYAEISGGYGFGLGENQLGMETYTDLTGDESYERSINGTLGSGLNLTIAPGYMFTKYIGAELGINYFLGTETTLNESSSSNPELTGYSKTTAYSNQFRIIPSLVLNTGGDKLYGFAKVGFVLPVTGATFGMFDAEQNMTVTPGESIAKVDIETKTVGNFSLGFRGSMGIGYQVTDMISINAEAFYTSLHINANNRVVEKRDIGGVNTLEGLPTYATETEFVDELNSSSNNASTNPANFDSDSPKEEITNPTNFSQIGFQIGVRFNF
jgi:hypothetical protein